MRFTFTGVDRGGNVIKSSVEAGDENEARQILEARDINVVKISSLSFIQSLFSERKGGALSAKDLVSIFINIAELHRAGMNMSTILEILRDDVATSSNMKYFCYNIHRSVLNGSLLSEAFALNKGAVDPIFVNFIKVAEGTGDYYTVFKRVIEYIKWSDDIGRRVKGVMIKSIFTLSFIMTLMIGVSTIVAPKIMSFLTDNAMTIPLYSRAFMAFSRFLLRFWAPTFGGIAGFIILMVLILKNSDEAAHFFDKLKLSLPRIGPLISRIESARFILFFNLMYASGSRMDVILNEVAGVAKNLHFQRQLRTIAQLVVDGSLLEDAMQKIPVFPVNVSKMVKVALKSSNVIDIMVNVKYFLDRESEEQIDMLVSAIKPFMLVITGTFVAWMAIAMFGPIYMNIANFAG